MVENKEELAVSVGGEGSKVSAFWLLKLNKEKKAKWGAFVVKREEPRVRERKRKGLSLCLGW